MTYEGYAVAASSTDGVLHDLRGYAVAVSSTEGVLYDLRGLRSGCQLHRRCVV